MTWPRPRFYSRAARARHTSQLSVEFVSYLEIQNEREDSGLVRAGHGDDLILILNVNAVVATQFGGRS